MFIVYEDMSVSLNRGDVGVIPVPQSKDGDYGYSISAGDILRIRVFPKKKCEEVALVKDFLVETATSVIELELDGTDTKIGDIINKPTTYWYEIELNPDTHPQTIVGYNEDGPKIFMLYPEGDDSGELPSINTGKPVIVSDEAVKSIINNEIFQEALKKVGFGNGSDVSDEKLAELIAEYIKNNPVITIDDKMSETSTNPVENKVVYQNFTALIEDLNKTLSSYETDILNKVAAIAYANFVAKEEGKGLSSNDFTDEYKEKLDNVTTGSDGVSATHSWDGTVLTITSASGTSSADLKGEKGDTGEKGVDGKDYDYIESYVKTEAENVIERVIEAQGNRTFTFACITDMHYGNAGYTDGVKHACQALKYIDARVKLDAVAVLGDYTDGYPETGIDNALGDFKEINNLLNSLRFAPNIRQQGNHDYYVDNFPITHRLIQVYSDDVVWGDKLGGYYYKDFEDYKLRVISVNTTEEGNSYLTCSVAQYQWFINSLDLSSKENSEDWQILILSHHPLDWYTSDEVYRFSYILEAYKNGDSWNGDDLSCDFNGKNNATLIGNIHGHLHNLLTAYINKGNVNTNNPTEVLRMCTPEACIDRANQYGGAWADSVTYNKTKDTANDTSFVIYCIDLDTTTIKAICYGAGYDREVNYIGGTSTVSYRVQYNLTNVTSSNTATSIQSGERYSTTLTASEKIKSVVVTMGGDTIIETVPTDGVITIENVSGNIVITAVAENTETPEEPETIVNLLDTVGYTNGKRFSASNGAEKEETGCMITGYIDISELSFTGGAGGTPENYYAWGVDFNNANNEGKCVFVCYDENREILVNGYIASGESPNDLTLTFTEDNVLVISKNGDNPPKYIRLSGVGDGANAVVTFNQLPN